MPVDNAASTPVERFRFSSCDAEETTEFFREVYVGNRTSFGGVAPRSGCVVQLTAAAEMRADRLSGDLTMHISSDPLQYATFGQLHTGTWNVRSGRDEALLGPGDSILYPWNVPVEVDAGYFDLAVVRLPQHRLRSLAASHTGIDARDLRFHSMTAVSPAMARHFGAALAMVHKELGEIGSASDSGLLVEHLMQTMMAAVLTAFPNTSMTDAPASGPGQVAPPALRRAMDFINTNADQPVTLADVAATAGTSGRALQHAFRRHYATTPMAYLRRVRLERAHRDLQAADPTCGDTVAVIAARWGYLRSDRFAAAYQAEYGVMPNQTLDT